MYDRWNEGEISNLGGFQTLMFEAYRQADSSNRKILETAYPDWFACQKRTVTPTENEKQFFWKDRSGRGFTGTISLQAILDDDDNDEELKEWAEGAEEGDDYNTQTERYTCIS